MENTNYRIEERDGCILIFGATPIDIFLQQSQRLPEGAVMDTNLARMAGANIVMGLPADTEALRKELADGVLNQVRATYAGAGLSDGLIRWLAIGERGSSSNAIVQRLAGIPAVADDADQAAHPCDPDDLRRCRLLLEQCPELHGEFPRMVSVSDAWKRLVMEWDTLCALMDAEAPDWREKGGRAAGTYNRMKALGC